MPTPKCYPSNAAKQKAYRHRLAQVRNAEQRAKGFPAVSPIPTIPGTRRWNAQMLLARTALQDVCQEMDAYYADRTDTWQQGDKGDDLQERMQLLEDILDQLDNILV
jgi:hypothetical protein